MAFGTIGIASLVRTTPVVCSSSGFTVTVKNGCGSSSKKDAVARKMDNTCAQCCASHGKEWAGKIIQIGDECTYTCVCGGGDGSLSTFEGLNP